MSDSTDGAGFEQTVDHLLIHCGDLTNGMGIVIVCDDATADMAELFADRARRVTKDVSLQVAPGIAMHGHEPPPSVADAMAGADLIVGLTTMSMAHTQARHRAAQRGARYLSMPDYSWDLLNDPSIRTDYRARAPVVRKIANLFTAGSQVHVTSPAGTGIRLDITGRIGNNCPGFVDTPGSLGSPPDIEANVSPIENSAEGIVVVDGSIPCREVGLVDTPVILHVREGHIVRFEGPRTVVDTLERMFDDVGDDKARVLAECGVGLNKDAVLQGIMLTDEGAFGCMHFGFGANATVGGANDVPFHLDFVFRSASMSIDGHPVLENGNIVQ